ncbi:hypothetical protein BSKO_14164 [Bryopsis sp. KO-2023]|nr:hypothetical protein BSKO_14164 [Bryopsis sp. KO-2023]
MLKLFCLASALILPPYRPRRRNKQGTTEMLTYIGQLFKHDIDLKAIGSETKDIPVDCDFYFNKACDPGVVLDFKRSAYNETKSASLPREQINSITSFLDGSVVYGSSLDVADKLRAHYKGFMSTFNGQLPTNSMGLTMNNPTDVEESGDLRAAGDVRANMNPALLALQSLFVKEHNRLAEELAIKNPTWGDEQLYYEARKWVVAYLQSICYYEYLPELGIALPTYTGYDDSKSAGVDSFFSAVASEYSQSQAQDLVLRVDEKGNEVADGHLILRHSFFQPTRALSAGIEPIIRGASFALSGVADTSFATSLQNYLFKDPTNGGSDFLALAIQRGRDHGIPDYNTARIDAYVGGLAEDPYMGSSVGELFYTSLRDQYRRIRDHDRFYFENMAGGPFKNRADDVATIKSTTLRDIILRNTDIKVLPQNIYVQNEDEPWPRVAAAPSTKPPSNPAPSSPAQGNPKATEALMNGLYTIDWEMESIGGSDYIRVTLTVQTEGWVGFGIARDSSSAMVGADIMVGNVVGGVDSVSDYWADAKAEPGLDTSLGGRNDVELISGSEIAGVTKIEFRRKLSTGDSRDRDINSSGLTDIIFAYHATSDTLMYHG